ncbi:methionine biosynthesis protein MetW [Dehalococcoidia bacterium]|nr:methionine biosynthesis protein MetW [Dehalococcoidia bacterium]
MGVEISQKAIELAKAKGVEVIKQDITKDDFELAKTFDYVIMADVLEHIPNPEKVVLKLANNCKYFFLITLPNTGFLGDRLRLLLGRFPKQWVFHPGEHLRFWSVKDFVFWCRELGFKVNKVIGIPDEYYSFLNWFSLYKIMLSIFSRYVCYIVSKRE